MDNLSKLQLQLVHLLRSRPATAALLSLPLTVVIVYPLRAIYHNYVNWLNVGQGGLPRNFVGWLVQLVGRLLADFDMTSLWPYSHPRYIQKYGETATKSYLKRALPWREPHGHRPFVGRWVAPQRQQSDLKAEESVREVCLVVALTCGSGLAAEMSQDQRVMLESLLSNDRKRLRIATSVLERHGPALFLAEGLKGPSWASFVKGEIGHFHVDADWSAHVSLTPADAMEVVEKGWGQRHAWSYLWHIGFTMLYAPRNEEEVEVVRSILEAGCAAMIDGAEPA